MKQKSHVVNKFIAIILSLTLVVTISSIPAFAAQVTSLDTPNICTEQISPRTPVYYHHVTYRYGDIEDGFLQDFYEDNIVRTVGDQVITFKGYIYLDFVEPYGSSYRATYSGDLIGYTND